MKKLLALFAALLLPAATCAETLSSCISTNDIGIQAFLAATPTVTITEADDAHRVYTGEELISRLILRDFNCDLFAMNTATYDVPAIAGRGFCLDLTDHEPIRRLHARLWPAIAQCCEVNGRIVAVPTHIQFDMLAANPGAFLACGLNESDVPRSFPELLDFLDRWIIRMEESPESACVFNGFDASFYNANCYPRWLVEMLLTEHIHQKQHAGEAISFDDPALLTLLSETRLTGRALGRLETASHQNLPSLFVSTGAALPSSGGPWLISARLSDDQPQLLAARLELAAANAGTASPETAARILASIAENPKFQASTNALLFLDAEPAENPSWPIENAYTAALIAVVENSLVHPDWTFDACVDLSALPENDRQRDDKISTLRHWYSQTHTDPDMNELNDVLARWKRDLAEERGRWAVSPEELADYKTYAPLLFFPLPSPFHADSPAGQNFRTLSRRFADGEIDAEKLVSELNRLAEMVRLETGK